MSEGLDIENAKEKINFVFSFWKKGELKELANTNIFCVISGKSNKDENATLQEQFQMWMVGYQLTETLFIFLKSGKFLILTSDKKKKFLQPLLDVAPFIEVLERKGENEENFQIIKNVFEKENCDEIGLLKDDISTGPFFEQCYSFLKSLQKKEVPIVDTVKHLLNYRSVSDQKIQKCGGEVACVILKNTLITTIEDSLDNETFERHDKIKDKALHFTEHKKCVSRLTDKLKVDIEEIDVIYSNVQSGNHFVLQCKNSKEKTQLSSSEGTIVVGLGIKYRELCCNVTRTLLLNAKKPHKELYNFTNRVMKYVLEECIKVGESYSSVCRKAIAYVEEHGLKECTSLGAISLKDYFIPIVGNPIGADFIDKQFLICEKNDHLHIEKSVSYNISIGFENVPLADKMKCAVWLSDTVGIDTNGKLLVMTDTISKDINTISYELEDSTSDDEKKDTVKNEKKKNGEVDRKKVGISASILNNAASVIVPDRLRRRNKNSLAHTNEQEIEELKKRQQALREKKIVEIQNKFSKGANDYKNMNKKNVKKLEDLKAYNDVDFFPRDLKPNSIHIDNKHECILLPIKGAHIPFHVSTIKNLSSNYEDSSDFFVLRINFMVPNQTVSKGEVNAFPTLGSSEMYIKELIFKSKNEKNFQSIVKQVKELIKLVKQKEVEADVIDSKASAERLILNKSGRRSLLRDLMTRPAIFTGRKILGTLELHTNGLRYSANSKGTTENIDILFDDIKHAFFQPCDGQLIILIHFHLKRFIMVGKKKTLDVQFYCEAGTQIDDLDKAKSRCVYDPDETRGELQERDQKNKLNHVFKTFVQQIQDVSKIEFEIPFPELTFSGVPNKSNVEIFVTANTINHLVEWPPFILTVEDIEIASLERVCQGLKNFDMVFVFKDYTQPVRRVDVIPIEYIDTIKKWLTTIDIVYYEGKNNLQWGNILKTILSDMDAFVESKGFEGFLGEDDDEDNDEDLDDDDDDEYEADESEASAEESDYEDSDDESLATESEEEEVEEEDSEEEGLSWDELEERAKKEDKKRGYKSDDDDDGNRTSRNRRQRR